MPAIILTLENEFKTYAPTVGRRFPYGTAGFRSVGNDMRHVMHRSGMLAVLRSFKSNQQVTGICITASHNPSQDNGVKLINPDGGMLDPEFEVFATEFINAADPITYFINLCKQLGADLSNPSVFSNCRIYCGRDTRVSSPELFECAKSGIECLGAQVLDLGIVTTPQVHFAVQITNQHHLKDIVTLQDYYTFFGKKFTDFLTLCGMSSCAQPRHLKERLVCDGANGVGAHRIGAFRPILKDAINVELEIRNDGAWPHDQLNFQCGTEFVQKEMKVADHFGPSVYDPMYLRCCSLDGDADRLVYHTTDAKGQLVLIDGDKIGTLYGKAIAKLLEDLIKKYPSPPTNPLRLGSVQTAYANGASTNCYSRLSSEIEAVCGSQVSFEAACAKTGVKNLHHKALDYDIAIYFESNGHGTVMANVKRLEEWAHEKGCQESVEFRRLHSYLHIFNQATGDAMADILAVEAALKYLEMSFMEWIRLYSDIPCVQRKVHMARSALDTLKPHPEHEKHLLQPAELQKKIDLAVRNYKDARAFVRPSGTEDVCRLYVEADILDNADKLCNDLEEELKIFFSS